MLILHIADLHFRYPECDGSMDADRPFRTLLVEDLRDRIATLGAVDAVIVGGDIAYRGDQREYAAARRWLEEVVEAAECSLADLYVVPGNHDVNQGTIKTKISVRNAQQAIISAEPAQREREFREQLNDESAGQALFAPLAAYNEFSKDFGCPVYAPDRLFWFQDRKSDDVTFRIFGLTSTVLSGAGVHRNEPDRKGAMYLSPLQTVLNPEPGVVNIVASHHPPDWCLDCDEVDEAFANRAPVQLFGHKHRQRIHCDKTYVRFSAGAVNPDRTEPGWEPGYNLIRLSVGEEDGKRFLDVEAHLLLWQSNPDQFRQKLDSEGQSVFKHRIPMRGVRHRPPPRTTENTEPRKLEDSTSAGTPDFGVPMSSSSTRNLVLRFWRATSASQRREISLRLGLITEEDMRLPEVQRYDRALRRAGERGLLQQLSDELDCVENP